MASKLGLKRSLVVSISLLISVHSLHAQDFRNSIASTDFDFITVEDPSTFEELVFASQGLAEMPDKRGERELMQDAYRFVATFGDGTVVNIFIDSKEKSQKEARVEAMRYVQPLGKLPTALRSGVKRLCVHSGGETTTAFSDIGLIVVYADNATVRISNHDLEETIFHESVHAAWDKKYAQSDKWLRAQMQDGNFVTDYAKSKPVREDLAESALFAYTILHHPERLPERVRTKLSAEIYHRISFVEELIPPGKPIHFKVEPETESEIEIASSSTNGSSAGLCDIRLPGIAADIFSHCLLTDFEVPEQDVQDLLKNALNRYDNSEELFQNVVASLEVDPDELRESVLANLYVNCGSERPSESIERELKNLVQSWQADE